MAHARFVKKARKNYPKDGISKGESYYWWAFMSGGRGGPKHRSKTKPRPSQLTQSEFWQKVYGWQEDVAGASPPYDEFDDKVQEIKDDVEEHKGELEDRLSNMPDSFRDGQPGERLQNRIDALDEVITELDNISVDTDIGEDEQDDHADEKWQEVRDALDHVSCE